MNIDDDASAANGPPSTTSHTVTSSDTAAAETIYIRTTANSDDNSDSDIVLLRPVTDANTGATVSNTSTIAQASAPSTHADVVTNRSSTPASPSSSNVLVAPDYYPHHVQNEATAAGTAATSVDPQIPKAAATTSAAVPIRSMRTTKRTVSESALRYDNDDDTPTMLVSSFDCPSPIGGAGRTTPSPMASAAGRRSRLRSYCDRSTTASGAGGGSAGSTSSLSSTGGANYTTARRVSFPENDAELVTGYLEPANPWATGEWFLLLL